MPLPLSFPPCRSQFGRGFNEAGVASFKLDGERFLGSKHFTESFESGTAPHNPLRALKSPSSPFMTYSMSIDTFPKSRYWH